MSAVVRLAAEYECYPVWKPTELGLDSIPASDLPISEGLSEAVDRWGDEYESTYRPSDPVNSGFSTGDAEEDFAARGRQLAHFLREELSAEWQVVYCDPETGAMEEIG